jgi:multisubunit Na+/H+ antiporter MnhG subunit
MTHTIVIAILLAAAVLVTIVSVVGLLAMPDPYQKLHYLGPVASISALCVTAAVLLREGLNQAGVKALFVAAVLLLMNAVLSHATARMSRIREFGAWEPQPGEHVREERAGEERPS